MKKSLRVTLAVNALLCLLCATMLVSLAGCSSKKRVGDDYYGFLMVPSSWSEYSADESNTSMLHFADRDKNLVISIMVYDDGSADLQPVLAGMEAAADQNRFENMKTYSDVSLDGGAITDVLKISFYYPEFERYMVNYFFIGSDGLVRYIAVESSDEKLISEGVDIVEGSYTFSE